MVYQVLENGKPADSKSYPKLANLGWDNSTFESFEAALAYALKWLGCYAPKTLEVGIPYDYSGYGDTIEIKKV